MKILIIRLSSLGDIVLTEPVVRALNNTKNHEIHYLTKRNFAEIILFFKGIKKIWYWENKSDLLKKLKQEKFDLVIDLHKKFNSTLIKYLISPKKVITYKKHHLTRLMMIKKMTNITFDTVTSFYLDTLQGIADTTLKFPQFEITEKKDFLHIFEQYEIPTNQTLVGIFPGATHFTKQLPVQKWINFLNSTSKTWKCTFLILGTHKEKAEARKIIAKSKVSTIDLTGVFNIQDLVLFMNKLDIIMTNDSGPMHIASALQKPLIAFFGATHTKLGFRPLNKKATVFQKNIKCQPCSLHGGNECPRKNFACMNSICNEEIINAFLKKLEHDVWKL